MRRNLGLLFLAPAGRVWGLLKQSSFTETERLYFALAEHEADVWVMDLDDPGSF